MLSRQLFLTDLVGQLVEFTGELERQLVVVGHAIRMKVQFMVRKRGFTFFALIALEISSPTLMLGYSLMLRSYSAMALKSGASSAGVGQISVPKIGILVRITAQVVHHWELRRDVWLLE